MVFEISIPYLGLFGIGINPDITWIFHTGVYLILVSLYSFWGFLIRKTRDLFKKLSNVFIDYNRMRTFSFDNNYYINIKQAGLFLAIIGGTISNLFVEIWQAYAYRWNSGNFFGLGDFIVGELTLFIVGFFIFRKLPN